MSECPNTEQLLAVLSGTEDASLVEVRAHLTACKRCQTVLSTCYDGFEVAAAWEALNSQTASASSAELARQLFERTNLRYEEHQLANKKHEIRSMAVMFTDMADSTWFAEIAGSRAAYEKRVQHNQLLAPLIDLHHGVLVEVVGDALLVVFNRTSDAARCAIAMQLRLAQYNKSEQVDAKSLEIHIRAGIHYGRAVFIRKAGKVEVAGRTVNIAARVEAGSGKQTDQILISEAALAQLLPLDEFAVKPAAVVKAKGITDQLQLYKLLWQEDDAIKWKDGQLDMVADGQLILAADTANRISATAEEDSNTRCCHGLFVNSSSKLGYVVPVWVKLKPNETPGIHCRIECDRVMHAAGDRAIAAAFEILRTLGFRDARVDEQAIEWWIDGTNVRYEGASIGLAITLATVAAYTGIQIDFDTAVTGAVDGRRLTPVTGLGSKWAALRDSGRFKKLVLPTANLDDLPTDARRNDKLQIIDVPDTEAAVLDVLGPALGLAASHLVEATTLEGRRIEAGDVEIQLWIQAETKQTLTRDISIVPEDDVHSWFVGEVVRFCVEVNRDCHLSLVNIGATGNVTVLIPNSLHPETAVRAGQVLTFPSIGDRFSMKLNGPPGRERVIAIATKRALKLMSEDFDQSGRIVCARPTTRDIAIVADELSEHLLGRCEISFYVSGEKPLPSLDAGSIFRSFDLG